VYMIRHRHPSAYQPMISFTPTLQEQGYDLLAREKRPALVRAHRQEYNCGLVRKFQGRKVWERLATEFRVIGRHVVTLSEIRDWKSQ
jgi:hypothetical protein